MKLPIVVIVACLACALHAAHDPPLKLIQTIPLRDVKGRFDHFAIDAKGQRLFLAALGNNTLEVIDLAGGRRLRSIAGMAKPQGVLYKPDSDQILVANGDDGSLKVLSGADYTQLQNLTAVPDADNLRLDSKTKLAWLGHGEGGLSIIDQAGRHRGPSKARNCWGLVYGQVPGQFSDGSR